MLVMRNFATHHQSTKNMTQTAKQIILTGLLLTVFTVKAFCQIGEASYDSRIKSKLIALGIKYEITDKGNFKVIFNMGNNRTQMVLINSNTYEYGGMEIREITSIAAITDDKTAFTQNTLFTLLERNHTYKLGAWQIDGGQSPYILQYGLRISANATQSVLDELIRLAAKVADEMEHQLTDDDKH